MVKKRKTMEAPVLIGDQIIAFLEQIGGHREKSLIVSLWENWSDVAGAEIAEHSLSISEKDRVLTIRVHDAIAMQELEFEKESIREKVNAFLRSPYFQKVRFTI